MDIFEIDLNKFVCIVRLTIVNKLTLFYKNRNEVEIFRKKDFNRM